MKILIILLISILAFCGVFYLDGILINWILSAIPDSGKDWLQLIKIILWFFAILWTTGIALLFGFLAGDIASIFLLK